MGGEMVLQLLGVNGCVIGFMIRSDSLQITPEILGLIAGIDEFKGAWRALGTLAPDRPVGAAASRHLARRPGSVFISHTCARTRQLKPGSYDRLFPNRDTLLLPDAEAREDFAQQIIAGEFAGNRR
jgi:hypothetical protein